MRARFAGQQSRTDLNTELLSREMTKIP